MMAILTEIFWKASIVLAAAFAANLCLRRSSAAIRHFLWTAAFAALLLLPAALVVIPRWSPAVPASSTIAKARVLPPSANTSPAQPVEAARTPVLFLLFLAGLLAASTRFLAGAVRISWMVRRAPAAAHARAMLDELTNSLGIRRQVRALQSPDAPMPLTWGIARPVVVLPEESPTWPRERLKAVLLHELLHVQRLDLLAQGIAQMTCCLYWFHPLAWLALAQLRKERERACDDAVLRQGLAAPDYAGHLMDLVRSLANRRTRWADAPAMAEASGLESRIRALLDRRRNRRPLTRRAALATATAVVVVLIPLAAVSARAQAGRGAIAGVVQDPSGARVPNCRVVAKSLDASNQETTTANASGEYQFSSIPSGRYVLEFGAPGFALRKMETTLVTGAVGRVDAKLELGAITESMSIRGQKNPAAAPNVAAPQRVRVGGSVSPARLVSQIKPVYPAELQQSGVQGSVVMAAVISKTGNVLNPVVRNTVDPRLAQAALDAVKLWIYQPALLNGQPVETLTSITLDFQLDQ